jgi:hypothetical protein
VNVGELERDLIRAAQSELGPSAADRERNQAELFQRLGAGAWAPGAPLGGAGSDGAVLRAGLGRAGPSRGILSRAALAVRSSRLAMLGLGLIVGAVVGGWIGFGLGQSGGRAERGRESSRGVISIGPSTSPDALAPSDLDLAAPGASLVAGDVTPGDASGASAEQGPLTDAVRDVSASEIPSAGPDPNGARSAVSNARGAQTATRRPASENEPSSLAAEIAMLQRARRALNADNGRLAVGLVQELDEQFPRGILIEERDATRILGLCQLGRVDEARRVARSFLERYPGSVYAERVRRSCVAEPQE